eukprot:scaffold10568_cov64-Cyclotella_meneghiniana.AAC.11
MRFGQGACLNCKKTAAAPGRYWIPVSELPPIPMAYWKCIKANDGKICGGVVKCYTGNTAGPKCGLCGKKCTGRERENVWMQIDEKTFNEIRSSDKYSRSRKA